MTGLLKDPDGSNAFERNDVTTAHFSSPTIKEIEELKDLRMKVQHLETQLVIIIALQHLPRMKIWNSFLKKI